MIFIFDLDGTLINSAERHTILLEKLLKKYGHVIKNDSIASYLGYKADGYSTKQYLSQILKLDNEKTALITSEWIRHIEDNELLKYDGLYPETRIVLGKLKSDNSIIFVSSRNNAQNLFDELKRLEIDRYADQIYISDPKMGVEGKSVFFQKIKNENDDKIIVVGDTEIDYQAAEKNDISAYILNRGFRSERFWINLNIKSYSDLYGLLGEF